MKDLIERIENGEAIADSTLMSSGLHALDIIRAYERRSLKLLNETETAVQQYDKVVLQNKSLQTELNEIKKEILKNPLNLREFILCECIKNEIENDDTRKRIIEFLTEMSSQNNRATAFPYYYTIADENERFEQDNSGEYLFYSEEGQFLSIKEILQEMFDNKELDLEEDDDFQGDI